MSERARKLAAAQPNTAAELKKFLPQSSYGQGEVVASPFQMARVAATVANGGAMPQGRWISDENNARTAAPQPILPADAAGTLARFMREVVTQGTGRRAGGASLPIAGKTGTAELAGAPSHAWFIGFAPAEAPRFVTPTGRSTAGERGRPAQLYRRGPATVLYPPLLRPGAALDAGPDR